MDDKERCAAAFQSHVVAGGLGRDARRRGSLEIVEKRTFAAAEPLLPLPPLGHDAFDDGAPRGGCDDCNQLATA
jgi:hypothetical protein